MRQTTKSGAFLMEFVLVILFFSVSAAVILQLYSVAHTRSKASEHTAHALILAQDTLERFAASELSAEEFLAAEGFSADGETLWKPAGGARLVATIETKTGGAVEAFSLAALAETDGRALFTLPAARYCGGGRAP